MNEIKLIRELMEKDIGYIKEKLASIDGRLDKLNGQTGKNTKFRIRAKSVVALLGTLSTVFGGAIVMVINRMWK